MLHAKHHLCMNGVACGQYKDKEGQKEKYPSKCQYSKY